jgi:SAM-dependent methyltransferase
MVVVTLRPSLATIVLAALVLCRQDRIAVRAWSRVLVRRPRQHQLQRFASNHQDGATVRLKGQARQQQRELYLSSAPPVVPAEDDKKIARIYTRPSLYDLAFGYRDYQTETRNLLRLHFDAAQYPATSVLEVAAGPARHCLALADNTIITKTYAIDNCPEMKEYSASIRQGSDDHEKLEYLVQHMRQINLPTRVDTAWLLLGSFQHMVTLSDAVRCFQSIHNVLNANGTFILELPHPNEIFRMVDCTTNTWTVPLEPSDDFSSTTAASAGTAAAAGQLQVIWGDADDTFDPITQIRNATIGFHLTTTTGGGSTANNDSGHQDDEHWIDTVPMKSYTVPELQLLAELTGFRIVQLLGALDSPDELVPVDDEDLAYRLVCVLQRL